MKKDVYQAPEIEVVELKSKAVLLAGSGEEAPGGSDEFSREFTIEE